MYHGADDSSSHSLSNWKVCHCPRVIFFNDVNLHVCVLACTAQLTYRGQRTTCGNRLYFSVHHVGPGNRRLSGRLGTSTLTPWATSPAQVFSFSHGLLLGALCLVLKQKQSGERRKGWVAKYDFIPHRMRTASWDLPWRCPSQPLPVWADVL